MCKAHRHPSFHTWAASLCCLLWFVGAQAADAKALKAAVVFNILSFVQWPDAAAGAAPLILCADSSGPMWAYLQTLQGRLIHSRPLTVRDLPAPAELGMCRAVMLEKTPSPQLAHSLRNGMPALVLVEVPLANQGLHVISLDEVDGRMVFDVDLQAARRNQVQLSSKLLRLARSVRDE